MYKIIQLFVGTVGARTTTKVRNKSVIHTFQYPHLRGKRVVINFV